MTVSYQYEVASSTSGGFTKLLFMWRGSLYKLIYRELFMFLLAFGFLSAMYRNVFTLEQKKIFEKVATYCDEVINMIPLSFVLGFYVAYIATRWWSQFLAIPWPDKIMHSLALYVGGHDEQSRILRRTLMRYLNLSLVLVLRSISSAVKRRFPTLEHLVEAGFITPVELEMYVSVPSVEFNTYWIPCAWFISLIKDARKSKMITDHQGLKFVMEVVTIATYSYFIIAVIGRQYLDSSQKPHQIAIDVYVPIFTILQFLFFMGLLKVAEQLINPFGDDDEDFELNWLIDRHTKVSYLGVDSLTIKSPPLVRDKYFNDDSLCLPYTGAAFAYKKKTYRGSVHNMQVPEEQQTMFLPEIIEEEDEQQQKTLKNSSSNLFINTPSPSAGIWRQSVCSTDGDPMSTAEEGVSVGSTPEVKEGKMMKFFFPGKRSSSSKVDVRGQGSSEMKQWSSNSTIDSYCSTVSGAVDTTVDGVRPGGTRSLRRYSGNSGQWKGVRWKPILDDSCGDVWSDNAALRTSASSTALCSPLGGGPVAVNVASSPPGQSPTAARTELTVLRQVSTAPASDVAGCGHLDKTTAVSLPNLRHPEDPSQPSYPGNKHQTKQPNSL